MAPVSAVTGPAGISNNPLSRAAAAARAPQTLGQDAVTKFPVGYDTAAYIDFHSATGAAIATTARMFSLTAGTAGASPTLGHNAADGGAANADIDSAIGNNLNRTSATTVAPIAPIRTLATACPTRAGNTCCPDTAVKGNSRGDRDAHFTGAAAIAATAAIAVIAGAAAAAAVAADAGGFDSDK